MPKLLLADDSVTIQRVIELTFADEDIAVTVVGDGRQAIERLKSDRPDIVLADIGMPERDGYEVAAFVKGDPQLAHIPVILLTGAFEPLDENRARSVGCDGVLVKPFEPQLVINKVRELLSRLRPGPQTGAARSADIVQADLDAPLAPPLRVPPVPKAVAPPAQPSAAAAPKRAPDALEEYFDRLDAAFATIESERTTPSEDEKARSAPEPNQPQPVRPAADTTASNPDRGAVTDSGALRMPDLASAFAALLAAEQGHPAPLSAMAPAPPQPIREAEVEDIVRRVIARLADDAVRNTVADTAERLVREEIERIKREARASGSGSQTGR
jgi:CheY-like chemotaxis protein